MQREAGKGQTHFHLFVGRVNPQFHGQGSGFITQLRNNKKNRQFSAVSRRRGELEAYIDFASNCHLELQFTVTIIKQNWMFSTKAYANYHGV